MQYIEIEKKEIPYAFEIKIEQDTYTFEIMYNDRERLFTVSLYDNEGNTLVYSEPIIYGQELFASVRDLRFPIVRIVPKDMAGKETEVTYENFGETVLLVIENEGDPNE